MLTVSIRLDKPYYGAMSSKLDGAKSMGQQFVMSVPKAGQFMGLVRYASYEAAKRGDLPVIKIGRRLFVPLRPFEEMLGLEPGTLNEKKTPSETSPKEATDD